MAKAKAKPAINEVISLEWCEFRAETSPEILTDSYGQLGLGLRGNVEAMTVKVGKPFILDPCTHDLADQLIEALEVWKTANPEVDEEGDD